MEVEWRSIHTHSRQSRVWLCENSRNMFGVLWKIPRFFKSSYSALSRNCEIRHFFLCCCCHMQQPVKRLNDDDDGNWVASSFSKKARSSHRCLRGYFTLLCDNGDAVGARCCINWQEYSCESFNAIHMQRTQCAIITAGSLKLSIQHYFYFLNHTSLHPIALLKEPSTGTRAESAKNFRKLMQLFFFNLFSSKNRSQFQSCCYFLLFSSMPIVAYKKKAVRSQHDKSKDSSTRSHYAWRSSGASPWDIWARSSTEWM